MSVPTDVHRAVNTNGTPPRAGFTLVETITTIGLAAMLLAIYTSMLTSTFFLRRTTNHIHATNFIQEELDTLRTMPFTELLNRTDGNLLGLAFARGDWRVEDTGSDKVLTLYSAEDPILTETGLAILPGNYREAFTAAAEITIDSASPAGWDAGIAFRYRDAENHYRFRISAGGIALDEVHQGTTTTLWSQSTTHTAGTPYVLEVVATGNQFTLKKDSSTLTTYTDTNDRFQTGDIAVFALDDALVSVDDVSVTVASTDTWNFEAETVGRYPDDWARLSWADLPGGAATLTITDWLGQPDLKQAVVTISWVDSGITKSMDGSTVISE